MQRLGLTEGDRKLKGRAAYAKALKEKHPALSIATASYLSGVREGNLRRDKAFREAD